MGLKPLLSLRPRKRLGPLDFFGRQRINVVDNLIGANGFSYLNQKLICPFGVHHIVDPFADKMLPIMVFLSINSAQDTNIGSVFIKDKNGLRDGGQNGRKNFITRFCR